MVSFGVGADRWFDLDRYDSASKVIAYMHKHNYRSQGGTQTHHGFNTIYNDFIKRGTRAGLRPSSANVPRVVVMLTDGKAEKVETAIESARALKSKGVTVFGLGIGSGIDKAQIEQMVSAPAAKHTFSAKTFDDLKDAVNSVVTQVCSATVVKSPRVEVGCLGDEYEEYEGCSCDRVGIPHTLDQLKGYGLATEQEYSSLDFKGWRTELASAHEQQTGYRLKKT